MKELQDAKNLNAHAQRLHAAVGLRPTQTSLVLLALILATQGTSAEALTSVEESLRSSVQVLKGVHNCRAEAVDAEAAVLAMVPQGAVAQDADIVESSEDLRIQELQSELAEAKASLGERVAKLEARIEALEARPEPGAGRKGRGKADAPPADAPSADAPPAE